MDLYFKEMSFCFTGTMRELRRAKAEQEARARGGYTQNAVNDKLDYLIIGDIPSRGWKHGSYGRKIEKAQDIHSSGSRKPKIASESLFMEALAKYPPENPGDVDAKIVVVNLALLSTPEINIESKNLEEIFSKIKDKYDCHISAHSMPAEFYNKFIYDDNCPPFSSGSTAIKCRIVKQAPLESDTQIFVKDIEDSLSNLESEYFTFSSFERKEGSADYFRLIKELPENYRIEGL